MPSAISSGRTRERGPDRIRRAPSAAPAPARAAASAQAQVRSQGPSPAPTAERAPGWLPAAMALQQSAGNAATTALFRSGPPSGLLEKRGWFARLIESIYKAEEAGARKASNGKLPKNWAGSLRSAAILRESFGDITTIVNAQLRILSAADMKTTYDGFYGAGKYDADGPLEGFERNGINYLNAEEQSVDTVIHESLHTQEHDDWDAITYKDGLSDVGEGATEILTKIAARKAGLRPSTSYPAEAKLVKKMCKASSLDELKKAYFLGNATFKTEVEAKLTGTWAEFKAKIVADDLAGARAMINP
jgi:hypothetical protein